MSKMDDAIEFLKRMRKGAEDEFGYGKEDHRMIMRRARERDGYERDGTMFEDMMGSNRTTTTLSLIHI